ncbi:MAG: macro domain-containing protein [Actinomycetota bacterium]
MVKYQKGDITKIEADVIVNAADTRLHHGGGVALAIARAAGPALEEESKAAAYCPLGEFAVTTAGNLKAREVVHIPTIDYTRGAVKISYKDLALAWSRVLKHCSESGYKTIATPILGGGVVGLDKEKVREILAAEAERHNEITVIIVEF